MNKRFKALSMLTAITMGAVLNGCSAPKESASVSQDKQEAGREQVTLRFLSYAGNYEEIEQTVLDAYHEKNPNVTVKIEYMSDMNSKDYLSKTDIMLMGGEPIDILMTPSAKDYAVRAASDSYLSLDQFFEAEGSKAEDEFNVIYRVNDQTYGIPAEMKYGLVLINKDMLDEAGLPVPDLNWTWEDYREYAIKLSKGEGADKIYGSHFHTFSDMLLYGITSAQKGNKCFNDDGTLVFDNPYFSKFLQFRYDLENADHASTPLADVKALNINYYDHFFNGKIAMLPILSYVLGNIGNEKYSHDFVTTFARLPLWEEDGEHYNPVGATIYSIAKTSEHPQEAFDFLKFWCTEGVKMKGMTIANQKGLNRSESAKRMVEGAEELVDMDTLETVMNDEKWVDSYELFIPTYQNEIETLVTEEAEKYLLDSQSLEDTVSRLMKRGNEIIAENSK